MKTKEINMAKEIEYLKEQLILKTTAYSELENHYVFLLSLNEQNDKKYTEEDIINAFNEGQALNVRGGKLIQGKEWFESLNKQD